MKKESPPFFYHQLALARLCFLTQKYPFLILERESTVAPAYLSGSVKGFH